MRATRTYADNTRAKGRLIVLLIKKLGGRIMVPAIELRDGNGEVLRVSFSHPRGVITFEVQETR